MAVTASGLYVATFLDVFDDTVLGINLNNETYKVAMYTNSLTPNFSTDSAYSATNEVSGTGYTAGGATVTTTTITETPTGTMRWDAADPQWNSSTIANARCGVFYADALTPKRLIALLNFGLDYSSTSGTFTITIDANGIFNIDLTPP